MNQREKTLQDFFSNTVKFGNYVDKFDAPLWVELDNGNVATASTDGHTLHVIHEKISLDNVRGATEAESEWIKRSLSLKTIGGYEVYKRFVTTKTKLRKCYKYRDNFGICTIKGKEYNAKYIKNAIIGKTCNSVDCNIYVTSVGKSDYHVLHMKYQFGDLNVEVFIMGLSWD